MFATALFFFPGFEARGLAIGMIIGVWPALFSERIAESQHYHPLIFLLMMVVLSGLTVFLFAWLMDKARISKKILPFLYLTMILFGCYFAFSGINYKQWQGTTAIAIDMASPEAHYKATRQDFRNTIIIPKLLAGGLVGLYFVAILGTLFGLLKLSKRIKNPNESVQLTAEQLGDLKQNIKNKQSVCEQGTVPFSGS